MLSEMQAQGPWVAFWLLDPRNTYDGDPRNGTEIDIMEYVVADGLRNHFNVANHWGPLGAKSGHEGTLIDAGAHGVDLREGWHTFGLQWARDKLTYYVDCKEVWSTTNGVATGDGQALLLSVEYQRGPGDAWNINKNVLNDAALLPDHFLVDYVRVYDRQSAPCPARTEDGGVGSTMLDGSGGKISDLDSAAEIASVPTIGLMTGMIAVLAFVGLLLLLLRRASPRDQISATS